MSLVAATIRDVRLIGTLPELFPLRVSQLCAEADAVEKRALREMGQWPPAAEVPAISDRLRRLCVLGRAEPAALSAAFGAAARVSASCLGRQPAAAGRHALTHIAEAVGFGTISRALAAHGGASPTLAVNALQLLQTLAASDPGRREEAVESGTAGPVVAAMQAHAADPRVAAAGLAALLALCGEGSTIEHALEVGVKANGIGAAAAVLKAFPADAQLQALAHAALQGFRSAWASAPELVLESVDVGDLAKAMRRDPDNEKLAEETMAGFLIGFGPLSVRAEKDQNQAKFAQTFVGWAHAAQTVVSTRAIRCGAHVAIASIGLVCDACGPIHLRREARRHWPPTPWPTESSSCRQGR